MGSKGRSSLPCLFLFVKDESIKLASMMMGRGKRREDNEDIGEKGNNKIVISLGASVWADGSSFDGTVR